MIRRPPALWMLLAIALVGCQADPSSTAGASTPGVAPPIEGVVISVDSAGLGDVRGFTLRPSSSGAVLTFVLGTLENPTEFPPSHLAEHQASSEPVRAWFRTEGGRQVVYRLEDAAEPAVS